MEKTVKEVGRREMRNLVRWRHHRQWGTYKCTQNCVCHTAPPPVVEEEDES